MTLLTDHTTEPGRDSSRRTPTDDPNDAVTEGRTRSSRPAPRGQGQGQDARQLARMKGSAVIAARSTSVSRPGGTPSTSTR